MEENKAERERKEDKVDKYDVFIITGKFFDFSIKEAMKLGKSIAKHISHNLYDSKHRKQKLEFKLRRNNKKEKMDKPELMYWTKIQLEGSPLVGNLTDEREKEK